jgi:hypothetical protein
MTEKLPVNTWDVTLLVRTTSANGTSEPRTFRVRAEQQSTAIMWALNDAHDLALEVVGHTKVEKLS